MRRGARHRKRRATPLATKSARPLRVGHIGAAGQARRAASCGTPESQMAGERRNAPGGPMCPTRKGRAIFAASGVAQASGVWHRGATRSSLATKIAAMKRVNINDLWYK